MINKESTINLKAIAICMVLFGHLVSAKKIDVNIAWIDVATFGVSIFLFLSGYGLYKSYEQKELKGYFRNKIVNVYMPFILTTILIGAARGFWSDKWLGMIKTILFINPALPIDGTMWYIYYIAMWYVIFYLTFYLLKSDTLRITSLFTISILVFNLPFTEKYSVVSFLFSFHAFTFTLGVAVAMCKPINKKLMLIAGLICFVVFSYLFSMHFIKYNAINHIMASLIAAPAFVLIISSLNMKFKPLIFLGGISYEIYLFEGAFRWLTFAPDKTSSCVIFFLITISCAYTLKSFLSKIKRPI